MKTVRNRSFSFGRFAGLGRSNWCVRDGGWGQFGTSRSDHVGDTADGVEGKKETEATADVAKVETVVIEQGRAVGDGTDGNIVGILRHVPDGHRGIHGEHGGEHWNNWRGEYGEVGRRSRVLTKDKGDEGKETKETHDKEVHQFLVGEISQMRLNYIENSIGNEKVRQERLDGTLGQLHPGNDDRGKRGKHDENTKNWQKRKNRELGLSSGKAPLSLVLTVGINDHAVDDQIDKLPGVRP